MSVEQSQVAPEVRELIQSFDSKLRVARATELATAGQLLKVESLLSQNCLLPRTDLEIALLGRIHVQSLSCVLAF